MRKLLKRVVFSLVPLALLLVLGAAAGEWWARSKQMMLDPEVLRHSPLHDDDPVTRACYRPSITAGYEPVPGVCGRNDQGMYGHHGLAKDAGTYRVLVLGDSIADQRDWVFEIERQLQAAKPDRGVEVWNSGVPGMDSCTELRVLEERGLQIKPDLILLQFCLNDFIVNSSVVPLENGGARLFVGERTLDAPAWVLRSHLATWLAVRYQASQLLPPGAGGRDLVAQAKRCVGRMKTLADENGATMIGAVFPALIQDEPLTARDRRETGGIIGGHVAGEARASGMMREMDIDVVEVREAFAGQSEPLEAFRQLENDVWHPNLPGQILIGRHLAERIEQHHM